MTDLSVRPSQLASFLRRLLPEKLAPLLVGPPGIGKTDIVRQVAEELGYRCICSHPATSDPTDYRGLPIVAHGKAEFSPFGQLRALIDADEPTVWFIDDLGQAPTSVQAALMQLIHPDGRRLNEVQLSPEVRIVAATNRPKDGAGVRGLLTPVLSRFHSILSIVPDLDSAPPRPRPRGAARDRHHDGAGSATLQLQSQDRPCDSTGPLCNFGPVWNARFGTLDAALSAQPKKNRQPQMQP